MADDEEALKIIVVGPSKSGKTFFSNLLAEVRVAERTLGAADEDAYSATAGVRILEFERSVNTGNGMQSVSIQLWDSSGDNGKENLWPAIQKDAAGAVVVYNPSSRESEAEANVWYEFFVEKNKYAPLLRDSPSDACLVIRHTPTKEGPLSSGTPEGNLQRVSNLLDTAPSTEYRAVEEAFDALVASVYASARENGEKSKDGKK